MSHGAEVSVAKTLPRETPDRKTQAVRRASILQADLVLVLLFVGFQRRRFIGCRPTRRREVLSKMALLAATYSYWQIGSRFACKHNEKAFRVSNRQWKAFVHDSVVPELISSKTMLSYNPLDGFVSPHALSHNSGTQRQLS